MNVQTKRLQRELEMLTKDSIEGVHVTPCSDDLCEWSGYIVGPCDTPYDGGKFLLTVSFTAKYPFEPPEIVFITPIYHPNINRQGQICIDILKKAWAPGLTIQKVLLSIMSLIAAPNPDDPLVPEIAFIYKTKKNVFDATARDWTIKYAKSDC